MVALVPLATGAGLLGYILFGVALPLGILFALLLTGLAAAVVIRRTPQAARRSVGRRALAGAMAGVAATLAYDGVRLALVTAFHIKYWPFDIFSRFGVAMIGAGHPLRAVQAVGIAYHYSNGICFGTAFALLVRRPNLVKGWLWAMMLETLMVSVYPGWLGLKAIGDLVSVSLVGHTAYGFVLGPATAEISRRLDRASGPVARSGATHEHSLDGRPQP
jgi:hypothetical protein